MELPELHKALLDCEDSELGPGSGSENCVRIFIKQHGSFNEIFLDAWRWLKDKIRGWVIQRLASVVIFENGIVHRKNGLKRILENGSTHENAENCNLCHVSDTFSMRSSLTHRQDGSKTRLENGLTPTNGSNSLIKMG